MNLIVGNGMIGRHLSYLLRGDAVMTTRAEIDLSHDDWDVPECDTMFICAAVTSTEKCSQHPEDTYKVNVTNTVKLAQRAPHVVFISSERVFDGTKPFRKITDEVCPTTEYGRQKAEAERLILKLGGTVVRFAKIIGWDVPLFEGWAHNLRYEVPIYPFSGMSMSPLPVSFAAEFLVRASKLGGGLYQVSAMEDLAYDRIACHICSYVGAPVRLIHPVRVRDEHPYTTLDSGGVERTMGLNIPRAWDTIYKWCEQRLGH